MTNTFVDMTALQIRARLLHSRGYNAREIREHLKDEGHVVDLYMIETWLSRSKMRSRGFNRPG